mmetsp:Transcript_10822/g.28907  ORF Transcript_10822/g.28907 Transcript_10822/m.28907 type:complete len:80 (+) Transcript_10822:1097-1336(+)
MPSSLARLLVAHLIDFCRLFSAYAAAEIALAGHTGILPRTRGPRAWLPWMSASFLVQRGSFSASLGCVHLCGDVGTYVA